MQWRRLAPAERQEKQARINDIRDRAQVRERTDPTVPIGFALALAAPQSGAHIGIDKGATRWESQWDYWLAWP